MEFLAKEKDMKTLKIMLGVILAGFFLNPALAADQYGTAKEAEAMVAKAIAYIKTHGREKAFAEISNPKGQFIDRDLYVAVMDFKGNMLAHGTNAKMIGKNLLEFKDADGKLFVKERIEILTTNDRGWQDYKYVNPLTKKIEPKASYFEKSGDMMISCGIYKPKN